jgi:hypothetical protein
MSKLDTANETTLPRRGMTVNETLAQRQLTHGNFPEQAETAQRLKAVFIASPNWSRLSAPQRESLELVATKIARILHGNPDEPDHWKDIAGYATLAQSV